MVYLGHKQEEPDDMVTFWHTDEDGLATLTHCHSLCTSLSADFKDSSDTLWKKLKPDKHRD